MKHRLVQLPKFVHIKSMVTPDGLGTLSDISSTSCARTYLLSVRRDVAGAGSAFMRLDLRDRVSRNLPSCSTDFIGCDCIIQFSLGIRWLLNLIYHNIWSTVRLDLQLSRKYHHYPSPFVIHYSPSFKIAFFDSRNKEKKTILARTAAIATRGWPRSTSYRSEVSEPSARTTRSRSSASASLLPSSLDTMGKSRAVL